MPPRSAKRKKPSPATAVSKSEPSEIESSLIDQNDAESEAPVKEEAPAPTTDDPTNMEVNEDVDSEERESIIVQKMELGQNEITEVTSCYQIDGAETLEENIDAPILNDGNDGIGDDGGEGAEAEGNHRPLELNSWEEVTVAAQIDGSETCGDNNVKGRDGSGEEDPEEVEEDPEEVMFADEKGKEDPVKFMKQNDINDDDASVINDKKKEKSLELFVSRLDKKTVEEDLIEVFGKFGEIKSVRVVRNKSTSRSKGFAFIRYASNEQAESAISASEGGIEVKGKQVIVSVSNDNGTTLYLGNICKSWTKERVLETLKNFGIENVEDVRLPEGPREGRTRGFAFLEFDSHPDAMSAFERLRKPDAIFGRDESAKVSFSQTATTAANPSEEDMSQVKTIYVEGLTDEIEAKVKEFCEQYGEVEEVRLYSRTRGKKSKDFGFICFAARENALACLEGFKNSDGGELKVKASIAKSRLKGQPQKQVRHGGFKAENEKEFPIIDEESKGEKRDASSNINGRANSKGKGKKSAKEIKMTQVVTEAGDGGNEKQAVGKNRRAQASSKPEKAKGNGTNLRMKAESRRMSNVKHGRNEKTSEKSRKNQRNISTSFGKRKRDTNAGKGPSRNVDFGTYRSQYTTAHSVPPVRYEGQSYSTTSGFKRPYADMEPHAGYLEPVARKQGRDHSGQFDPPAALHYSPYAGAQYPSRGGYIRSEVETYPPTRAVYQNPPGQARYVDPVFGTHAQPHAGYFQIPDGNSSRDLHSVTVSRGGRQDPPGIVSSAYGAASSIPSSYPPQHYTSRVGYEAAGSSGGDHYISSRVNQPERRTYY